MSSSYQGRGKIEAKKFNHFFARFGVNEHIFCDRESSKEHYSLKKTCRDEYEIVNLSV